MERKYYLRGLGLGIAVTAVIMGILTSRDKTMTDQEIIARAKELGMVENTVLSDMNEEEGQESADISAGQEAEAEPVETDNDSNPDATGNASAAETAVQDGMAGDTPADTEESDAAGRLQNDTEKTGSGSADGSRKDAGESGSAGGMQENAGELGSTGKKQGESEESGSAGQSQTGVNGGNDNKNGGDSTSSPAVKTITVSPGDGSHTVARKLAEAGIVSSADTYDEFLCRNGYDKKLRTGTFSIPAGASEEQIARIVTGAE